MAKRRKMVRKGDKWSFKTWFAKMQEVMKDDETVIFTDVELVAYVNGHLKPNERISYSLFTKWVSPTGQMRVETIKYITDEQAEEFRNFLAFTRAKQKLNLTKESNNPDNKQAYKQQWILERKFQDLRANPQIQLNSSPTIKIEAGSGEQAKLIEDLMNGDETIDIDHKIIDNE